MQSILLAAWPSLEHDPGARVGRFGARIEAAEVAPRYKKTITDRLAQHSVVGM